jgi:hypothetical protein
MVFQDRRGVSTDVITPRGEALVRSDPSDETFVKGALQIIPTLIDIATK